MLCPYDPNWIVLLFLLISLWIFVAAVAQSQAVKIVRQMSALETEWVGFIGACKDPNSVGVGILISNMGSVCNWGGIMT
jgi:hypothetical protein